MRKGAITATHALVMKFGTQPRLLELPIRNREILHVYGRGNRGSGWKTGCGLLLWPTDMHTSPGAWGAGRSDIMRSQQYVCVLRDAVFFGHECAKQ